MAFLTVSTLMPRYLAIRPTCHSAAAGEIWGSRPLAEAVTKSSGIGAVLVGSLAFNLLTAACTFFASSGFRGPKLLPVEALASYFAADGRPHRYLGSSKFCPIRREPIVLPWLSLYIVKEI